MQVADRLRRIDDAVVSMERRGVYVDVALCESIGREAAIDEANAWEALRPWICAAGKDPETVIGLPWLLRKDLEDGRAGESGKELQALLHQDLGLPPSKFWKKGRVKDGEIKTDATAIEYLAGQHPEHRGPLRTLLALRKARSCLKYLRKLPLFVVPGTGRVHPVYGPASDDDDRVGAITGRFAVKRPEFQQIPRDPAKDKYGIRRVFRAQKPGHVLLAVDQSALEVVVLAHVTAALFADFSLCDAVSRGAPDIHSVHAIRVFRDVLGYQEEFSEADNLMESYGNIKKAKNEFLLWSRDAIKAIWYGLQYGKGAWGFGSTIFDSAGDPLGEERAQLMIDGLMEFRPGVRKFNDWVPDYIDEHNGIPSLAGRWCDLSALLEEARGDYRGRRSPEGYRGTWSFKRATRRASNYPMQAGGADIMGEAITRVNECPEIARTGFLLDAQVHDELLLEGPAEAADEVERLVVGHMEASGAPFGLLAQLQATGKYSDSWAGCK